MSMNINRSRSRLLTGAGTIVLATMLTTAAHADPATTNVDDPTLTDIETVGHVTSTSGQTTESNIEAQVVDVFGGIDGLVDDGTSTGSSNTVSTNTIQANAIANRFTGDVDLGLINSTIDPDADDSVIITPLAHGAAALSVQQTAGANVGSLASSNELTIDRPGFESGSAIAEQNSIAATSVANQANQSIAGIVPNGYVSDASGTSSIDFPAGTPVFQAEGTVVASTIQQAVETGARALSADNQITLDLTADGANVVASAPQLDSNSIAASTTVNSAQTTIDLQSDEAPLFTGSAVLSNVQTNNAGFFGAATAETVSSSIVANVYGNDALGLGDVNTLTGSLSVAGNSIASSVSGNDATGAGTAGNRILIGDAMSFEGSGAVFPSSTAAYDDSDLAQSATADIVINSSQSNVAADFSTQAATTASFEVLAQVQSLDEGTIDVAGNRVTATVTGNDASSAIASGEDAASFTGSVALANQQTNFDFQQSALVTGGVIGAETGTDGGVTQNSGITVADNVSSASAYGNNSSQSVALDSNGLDIGTGEVSLTAGTRPDGNASAAGGATLLNLQSDYNTAVSASQAGTRIGLDADSRGVTPGDTISGSTLAVTNNTQEAVALGSSASNAMSLASNDVGSGAGIVSAQIMNTGSSVSAGLGAAEAGVVASTHVDGSQLDATGNLQRAIAYGGSVSNGLTVDSNSLTLAPSAGWGSLILAFGSNPLAFSDDSQPDVTAAFGVLSDQSTQADVTASATGSRIGVTVEGDVAGSTVTNEGNGYVAAAYGNDAANGAMLSLGNVDAGGFAAIGAISNTQAAGDETSTIAATATGGNVFNTDIEDDVTGSSVSTSGNAIQAVAAGNRSTGNQLTVDGNNIDSSSILSGNGVNAESYGGFSYLMANASFSVQNAQAADGAISASQLDDAVNPTTAAAVLTTIGTLAVDTGDVTGSTVSSDGNRSTASATGNTAVSGVSLSGNQLATTTGVQNFQTSNADLSALIGMEGTAGSPGFDTTASGSGVGFLDTAGDDLIVPGVVTVNFASYNFSLAEANYLNSLAGVSGANAGGNTISLSGIVDTTVFTGFTFSSGADGTGSGDESITLTGFSQPGTAGLPNAGGVTIAVNGDIAGSMLSVDGNSTAGSVIGNNGTNTLNVAGTSIAAGSGGATARAGVLYADIISVALGAEADNALSNLQTVGSSAIESEVFSTFALDAVEGVAIDEATLSVSGNDQSSTAVANTAVNQLTLAANDIASGSALSSSQSGDADVAANSIMEVFAPAAVSNSSVSMSDNANRSLAVVNDATNVASVSGANVSFVSGSGNAVLTNGPDGLLAEGDQVLANQQAATTTVDSTAETRLYNEDRVEETGLGLRDSSLVIAGNSTSADGSANRAFNSLSVEGSASQTASAGVSNLQNSSAAVSVAATSTVGASLNGGNSVTPAAATTGSSIAIEGNATTALARGNAATNVLNVSTGASYGTAADLTAGSSLASVGGSAVNAQAAVLNGQTNSAPVQATSTGVTYTAALNAGTGSPAVQASTVAVSGNRVATEAYGNSATNSLTMASLNTGTPTAAVGNYQTNAGFVSARAASVTYGINSGSGNVGASSLGVTGNAITATAVGNSAATSITAGR